MKQRKEWDTPGDTPKLSVKLDLHPKKTMICVWRDWEMLEWNVMVTKELYIAQLHRLKEAMRLKIPYQKGQTILLHNHSRPHVAQVAKAFFYNAKAPFIDLESFGAL